MLIKWSYLLIDRNHHDCYIADSKWYIGFRRIGILKAKNIQESNQKSKPEKREE